MSNRLEKLEITIDELKNIYSHYSYGAFTYKCLNASVMPNYMLNMSTESRDSETYRQITLNNLEKNGLLKIEIGNIRNSGKLQIKYKITLLGELVLDKIGALNNE